MPVRRPSRPNGESQQLEPDCKTYNLPPLLLKHWRHNELVQVIELRDPRELFTIAFNGLGKRTGDSVEPVY